MKKAMWIFLTSTMMLVMTACGEKPTSVETETIMETETTMETEEQLSVAESETESNEENDTVFLESDPLPEVWRGEWICVYSEAYYFAENETIFVKDFDNAVLYTDIVGDTTYENNRWFCYDEETRIIHIFNEMPFEEDWIRDSFEVKKESDSEIILTRVGTGEEVRFEKTGNSIYDSDEETESTAVNEVSNKKDDEISPEFKEAMDSYEAFFDEYCEFMKKYSSSDDAASMLEDYAEYMTQYAETMEKMETINQDELSTAEVAYYAEVSTRISTKLLDVVE